MGRRIAPFVALLFIVPLLNARVTTVNDAAEDDISFERERRFTNGGEQWTHGITEESSSDTSAVSPSNAFEKSSPPIVLKPLQLTLVHKSVYNLKPDSGISSRQERNLGGSSYSCLSCSSKDNNLFESSISRSGRLFSFSSDSVGSSLEQNVVKETPKKISTHQVPLTWKSLLYKPRKSVVRGFLATPGKPIKEITEFSLISKYNDKSHSKNIIDSAENEPKKISTRPKFTITPAIVKHIPLSFTETNEIFHNLLVKFVSRKKNEELQRDSQSYENNEIRRVGVPISNLSPHTQISPITHSDHLPSPIYRQYRQVPQVSRIVPATLVFKHFSTSHQRR